MRNLLSDIADATRTGLAQISQRLQRTTRRERILLGTLVVGAGLYAPVHALDAVNRSSDAYVEALGDQSSARLAAQAARRIEASAADQLALQDMKTWGFAASNSAVAQVLIEQRLTETAEKVGLANPVISTETGVEVEGTTYWVKAEVQTDLKWDPAFAFIEALGEWPEGFRVTGFRYEIRPVQVTSRNRNAVTGDVGSIYYTLAFPVVLEELPEDVSATGPRAAEARR